jgi:hypothetical protein
VTFGLAGVIVPLSGIVANLHNARKAPTAQSRKAAKMRGLIAPNCDKRFLFMML